MILGERTPAGNDSPTLDNLFRRAAARRPDAVALIDPPNRADFTDGPPRRLRYGEADGAVSGLAARLRRLALPSDSVIGIALPNKVESVLTLLAVLRAGMIAAPLPLLWRRAEMANALERVGAKAIVTAARIGELDSGGLAMQVAAELFTVRHLCAFGIGPPDGVIALDQTPAAGADEIAPAARPTALDVAVATFDVTPDETVAVARNHAQWIAAGLILMLESELAPDATILVPAGWLHSPGLPLQVMPWLLSGGTLSLHHAFDAAAFSAQGRADGCDTMVWPGPLLPALAAAGLLDSPRLRQVIAAWRAPERMETSPAWQHADAALTDVAAFGEIGLVASRRGPDGRPSAIQAGEWRPSRAAAQTAGLLEMMRSEAGALTLRGLSVPRHSFPPGAERLSRSGLRIAEDGFVDTGYACRLNAAAKTLQVTAPPPGLVSIGGHRLILTELQDEVRRLAPDAAVTALPDSLAGHRLAGIAPIPPRSKRRSTGLAPTRC